MAAAPQRTEPEYGRALLFHEGLPIALCPVTALDSQRLDLDRPPLRLERNIPVCVDLYPRESYTGKGLRIRGRVEEAGEGTLRIRVEARDQLDA